jgi:hypothetical protein
MILSRTVLLSAALLIGAGGCTCFRTVQRTAGRQTIADREAVRRSLPSDVTLETIAQRPSFDIKITVEQELIQRGAHIDEDGTLRDSSGKEIRFFHEPRPPGTMPPLMPPTPEQLRKQEEWEQYKKDYAVIFITWNPDFRGFPP